MAACKRSRLRAPLGGGVQNGKYAWLYAGSAKGRSRRYATDALATTSTNNANINPGDITPFSRSPRIAASASSVAGRQYETNQEYSSQ